MIVIFGVCVTERKNWYAPNLRIRIGGAVSLFGCGDRQRSDAGFLFPLPGARNEAVLLLGC